MKSTKKVSHKLSSESTPGISPAEIAFREGRSRHAPGAIKCIECGAKLATCRKCKIPYCPRCAEASSGHRRCSDCYPERL